jgi:formate hydrogenlyase subunit 6/NADH:ubiquinone oxidoreductase subunit I
MFLLNMVKSSDNCVDACPTETIVKEGKLFNHNVCDYNRNIMSVGVQL